MNILIIGNGFDLAHGLPTTYKDFLDFTNIYRGGSCFETIKTRELKTYFENLKKEKFHIYAELGNFIIGNTWLTHFNFVYEERNRNGKTGWIDFESEISELIQILENNRRILIEHDKLEDDEIFLNDYHESRLRCFYTRKFGSFSFNICKELKDKMLTDLYKLIRALEIYLSDYVNNLSVDIRLPDIAGLKIDKVLSFNYTNTYERLYGKEKPDMEYNYIHGKANINHSIDNCDMVLGIDEYLTGEEKNSNTYFIQFKKFFQRIYKKTGAEYVDWLKEYEANNIGPSVTFDAKNLNVYIFGHSLDITDRDILRKFILSEVERRYRRDGIKTQTTIYHFNQNALGKQIANLVKVIGQDNLISMVHGSDARIILQQQQDE